MSFRHVQISGVANLFVVTVIICKLLVYRSNAFKFTLFYKSASSFQITISVYSFRMEALTKTRSKHLHRRTSTRKKAKRRKKSLESTLLILPKYCASGRSETTMSKTTCSNIWKKLIGKRYVLHCMWMHIRSGTTPIQNWNSSAVVCSIYAVHWLSSIPVLADSECCDLKNLADLKMSCFL